jgi:hypothetical protein
MDLFRAAVLVLLAGLAILVALPLLIQLAALAST